MTRLDQSRASENIWWIITNNYIPKWRQISTTFTDTKVNNCFSICHARWITSGPKSNAGVNVNPHPGTRWGLVGKRRGFDRNRIPEGVGDWEIFVFNLPQGRGFGWGFVVSQLLWSQRLFISKINSCAYERSSRGECFCYLNLVFCHWNLSHLLSKSGAIHKMNIHLQLKMYTFIFRRCLSKISSPTCK